jgi:hypothetical protein
MFLMGIEFEIDKKEDYIHIKYNGEFPVIQIFDRFDKIIDHANEFNVSKVLLDLRYFDYELTNMESFHIGEYISKAYKSNLIKIACLRDASKKDDFTEFVTTNSGADFRLFNNEKDAIKWLKNTH